MPDYRHTEAAYISRTMGQTRQKGELGQTHKQTDRCYQVHYLPCPMVDNNKKLYQPLHKDLDKMTRGSIPQAFISSIITIVIMFYSLSQNNVPQLK